MCRLSLLFSCLLLTTVNCKYLLQSFANSSVYDVLRDSSLDDFIPQYVLLTLALPRILAILTQPSLGTGSSDPAHDKRAVPNHLSVCRITITYTRHACSILPFFHENASGLGAWTNASR
ncbi:hypothetical protein EJ06DRAFT_405958 [Trichodelitschia bisporula]|uniref:Uncharacterized protein n=1 Tax=Trichodelitschia bisporula TaxID=703511 RepID=A0A6G1HXP4_9PEZI|nr:hypothetical protein EJ06DRAFT_405958 [Trichodelitschia bisporula]